MITTIGPWLIECDPELDQAIVTEHFTLWCSARRELVPEPFRDFPVVQVDFSAELPWVLSEPEPD